MAGHPRDELEPAVRLVEGVVMTTAVFGLFRSLFCFSANIIKYA